MSELSAWQREVFQTYHPSLLIILGIFARITQAETRCLNAEKRRFPASFRT